MIYEAMILMRMLVPMVIKISVAELHALHIFTR